MKKYLQAALFTAVMGASVLFPGCEGGDPNSMEGLFKGCYTQVSKVQSALEAAQRTRGTLEGISTLEDAYQYMSGGSEQKYTELRRRQEMYCSSMTLITDPSTDYYYIEAIAISAKECLIHTEPKSTPEPRELQDCR